MIQLAETLGYHLIMTSDHIAITPDVQSRYPAPFYEPLSTLGWLAGAHAHGHGRAGLGFAAPDAAVNVALRLVCLGIPALMMVVPPFTVRVPMPQLFRRCIPYGDDFDFKRERHAGQWVVAVDH